jgi:hypothetical protein
MNVFTDEYTQQEIDFMAIKPGSFGEVDIVVKELVGRNDDYLSVNFYAGGLHVPMYLMNRKIWMSLTPMEIQSHVVPIAMAEGRVGVGGLGLGYFAARMMADEEVESVRVFETSADAIKLFEHNFGDRDGFGKVELVNDDAARLGEDDYDMIYMDIWPYLLDTDIAAYIPTLASFNTEKLRYWGQELALLAGFDGGEYDKYELHALKEGGWFTHHDFGFFNEYEERPDPLNARHTGEVRDIIEAMLDNPLVLS